MDSVQAALMQDKVIECLNYLFEQNENRENENTRILLMTFEIPRKSYHKSREWVSVGNVWRHGLLSAGETGTDETGDYQVFSLTANGLTLLNTGSLNQYEGGAK